MKDIIQKIIDIEKKTNQITQESEEMKKNLSNIIEKKISENFNAINIHKQGILMKLYQDSEKIKETKIKEIKEGLEKKINFINNEYENNRLKLEENIYKNILEN